MLSGSGGCNCRSTSIAVGSVAYISKRSRNFPTPRLRPANAVAASWNASFRRPPSNSRAADGTSRTMRANPLRRKVERANPRKSPKARQPARARLKQRANPPRRQSQRTRSQLPASRVIPAGRFSRVKNSPPVAAASLQPALNPNLHYKRMMAQRASPPETRQASERCSIRMPPTGEGT